MESLLSRTVPWETQMDEPPWNIPGILDLLPPPDWTQWSKPVLIPGWNPISSPFPANPTFFPSPVGCCAHEWWSEALEGCWKAKIHLLIHLFPLISKETALAEALEMNSLRATMTAGSRKAPKSWNFSLILLLTQSRAWVLVIFHKETLCNWVQHIPRRLGKAFPLNGFVFQFPTNPT